MKNVVNPRKQAYAELEKSMLASGIDTAKAQRLTQKLLGEIREHRLFSHPAFSLLREGKLSNGALVETHLDYRLLVKQFTDTILAAQFKTRELEAFLNDNGFMAARFLLTLNILDELGFYPGEKQYLGHPCYSHFVLFDRVLGELGVAASEIACFENSEGAKNLYRYIESIFSNLNALLVYLIVTEEGAMHYSPAMRSAAERAGVNVWQGYYNVHGDTSESVTEGEDDLHQDDAVKILQIVIDERNYADFSMLAEKTCTLWAEFWDEQSVRSVLEKPLASVATSSAAHV